MKYLENLFIRYRKAERKFYSLKRKLDKAIIEEYGFHYSDKDLDYIIDALDYGRGRLTFSKFDEIMKKARYCS